jgi:hypothetical protein
MNLQVKAPLKNLFEILYSKLPETVILIIFEFEGLTKENNDKFIKMFKDILLSKKYYSLAFRTSYQYDDDIHLKSVPSLNKIETYKYILRAKKHISFCECKHNCCIKFMYDINKKYICGCHEKKSGGISYIFHLNAGKKIYIRTENTGFCVKII